MNQSIIRSLLLAILLLQTACSRDLSVSTVLPASSSLRPGDKVYLADQEVGTVRAIEVSEATSGIAVTIDIEAEQAQRVQSNAVAYTALEGQPALVLSNPSEPADPVAPGGRLRGLSPLEAALWRGGDAAQIVAGIVDQFGRKVADYLKGEEWTQAQAEVEAEIAGLADDSRQAAETVLDTVGALFDTVGDRAAEGANLLADELASIRTEIERLEVEGHEQLATALRRLLERLEKIAQPEAQSPAPTREV
ncbi:MAG: MlaD family protein [Pseudomonadota bacterium]